MKNRWIELHLLSVMILAGSAGYLAAQTDGKAKSDTTATADLFKKAVSTANDGDFSLAASQLDQVLKQSPDDRDALYFLTIVAGLAAEKASSDAQKIALLQRASKAYAQLQERHRPLSGREEDVARSVALNPARIATLEGHPEQALTSLSQLVAQGYPGSAIIDLLPAFEPVRRLPDYQGKMIQAHQTAVKTTMTGFKTFPFDFALKTVDGKPIKSSDFKGNVTIVDVWGTWCPPCREEIPHFVDLAQRFEKQGLKVVGINCNEEGTPAEVKKTIDDFIAANKIPYPCVLNDDTIESKIPDFAGYPTTLFLDRSGKVRLVQTGYSPLIRLEAIIQTLLSESSR